MDASIHGSMLICAALFWPPCPRPANSVRRGAAAQIATDQTSLEHPAPAHTRLTSRQRRCCAANAARCRMAAPKCSDQWPMPPGACAAAHAICCTGESEMLLRWSGLYWPDATEFRFTCGAPDASASRASVNNTSSYSQAAKARRWRLCSEGTGI